MEFLYYGLGVFIIFIVGWGYGLKWAGKSVTDAHEALTEAKGLAEGWEQSYNAAHESYKNMEAASAGWERAYLSVIKENDLEEHPELNYWTH